MMDKHYSFDPSTGFLWSWDGDFHFEGVAKEPPRFALDFCNENREFYEAVGALFLSGYSRECVIVHCDSVKEDVRVWFGKLKDGLIKRDGDGIEQTCYDWGKTMRILCGIGKKLPIVFCGKMAKEPRVVADLCASFPSASVYVCPVVDELAAFGRLAIEVPERPRKVPMWFPNKEEMDAPSLAFDPVLDGDGLGKMAALVCRGKAAFNDMRRGAGIPTFYGKVLHDGKCGDGSFILHSDEMARFFPTAPVSAKYGAATNVFVSMEPSDLFRKLTGVKGKTVDVIVSTEYIPDLPVFMGFCVAMSKIGVVGVSDAKDISFQRSVPVFRYDKAYRVRRESFDVV